MVGAVATEGTFERPVVSMTLSIVIVPAPEAPGIKSEKVKDWPAVIHSVKSTGDSAVNEVSVSAGSS